MNVTTAAAISRLRVKCAETIPGLLLRGPTTSYNLGQLIGGERQAWAAITQQAVQSWLLDHPELVWIDADLRWHWRGAAPASPVPPKKARVRSVMSQLPDRDQLRADIAAKGQAIVAATHRISLSTLSRYVRQVMA